MTPHRLGGGILPWAMNVHRAAAKELDALPYALQDRLEVAFNSLAADPLTSRPGTDVKKLCDLAAGKLYRLRVGQSRACCVIITDAKEIWIMAVDWRGAGYDRMIAKAIARSASLTRGM